MKDPEIRALLRPTLPPGLVLDELEIRGGARREALTLAEMADAGSARADVVVVGDLLHGYEVKGASDSRARLPRQVAAYSRVFDFCSLVTEPKHAAKATAILPAWWGVLVVEGGALQRQRLAERNPQVEAYALGQMLWRVECEALLRANDVKVARRKRLREVWTMVESLPIEAIRTAVCEALKSRRGGEDRAVKGRAA